MDFITSILLTGGVMSLSYGINQGDKITIIIGAICLGAYNGIYYCKIWRK